MAPDSDPESLRADVLRRWKEELYSLDSVVSAVAVVVALPAGLAGAFLVAPELAFAVWFAAGVGPGLAVDAGLDIDGWRHAAVLGFGLAALDGAVATAAYLGASVAGASPSLALVPGAVLGLVAGELLARYGPLDR
ncbi:MAG: hypothetical protein ABEJ85_05880 [Haloarculaceae archaeon]